MGLIKTLKKKIKEHKDGHCCCCHAVEPKTAAKPSQKPAGAGAKR